MLWLYPLPLLCFELWEKHWQRESTDVSIEDCTMYTYTVNNGSLLKHNNVSLLGHVSKIVSILLSKLAIVPKLTHSCGTVTTHF